MLWKFKQKPCLINKKTETKFHQIFGAYNTSCMRWVLPPHKINLQVPITRTSTLLSLPTRIHLLIVGTRQKSTKTSLEFVMWSMALDSTIHRGEDSINKMVLNMLVTHSCVIWTFTFLGSEHSLTKCHLLPQLKHLNFDLSFFVRTFPCWLVLDFLGAIPFPLPLPPLNLRLKPWFFYAHALAT